MTKTEALQFLELPESANEDEIQARLKERLAYFEDLKEHAPSDFLRRLNARSVETVKGILRESKVWQAAAPVASASGATSGANGAGSATGGASVASDAGSATSSASGANDVGSVTSGAAPAESQEPEENGPARPLSIFVDEEVVQDAPAENFFTRIVTGIFTVKRKENLTDKEAPVGWLIRHTENLDGLALPVYAGKNYIGRKAGKFKPFLAVEDDPHVSKIHAVIYADPGEIYLFYVADNEESNEGKASTNGTYVNGQDKRIAEKLVIRDNDTIQIGVTKFVLRYAESEPDELMREVAEKAYVPTIVLNN